MSLTTVTNPLPPDTVRVLTGDTDLLCWLAGRHKSMRRYRLIRVRDLPGAVGIPSPGILVRVLERMEEDLPGDDHWRTCGEMEIRHDAPCVRWLTR